MIRSIPTIEDGYSEDILLEIDDAIGYICCSFDTITTCYINHKFKIIVSSITVMLPEEMARELYYYFKHAGRKELYSAFKEAVQKSDADEYGVKIRIS